MLVSWLTDRHVRTRWSGISFQGCRVHELEAEGGTIMFFRQDFESLTSNVPLVYPCHILNKVVPLLTAKKSSIVTVTPSAPSGRQEKKCPLVDYVKAKNGLPYGSGKTRPRLPGIKVYVTWLYWIRPIYPGNERV